MKNISLFILCSFLSLRILAQAPSSAKIKILDRTTHKGIPYASVMLLNNDHEIKVGATTNKKGEIQFKQLTDSLYNLKITALGYQGIDTLIHLKKKDYLFQLAPSDIKLKEAGITSIKKGYEQKYDRKVFTIKEAQKATSFNVLDLLKTIPGVIVDEQEGTVHYRGQDPEIRVNDLPDGTLYPDYTMIPADKVKKIELIDASNRGNILGGIINIILVEYKKKGLDGYLGSDAKQAESPHALRQTHFLNLNNGFGKDIVFGNFILRDENYRNLFEKEGYSENSITQKENILKKDTKRQHNQAFKAFLGLLHMSDSLTKHYFTIAALYELKKNYGEMYYSRGNYDYFKNNNSRYTLSGLGYNYMFIKKYEKTDKELELSTVINIPAQSKSRGNDHYTYPNNDTRLDISSYSPNDLVFGMVELNFNNPLKSHWNFSMHSSSEIFTEDYHTDRLRNAIVDTINLTQDKSTEWENNLKLNIGRRFEHFRIEAGLLCNHRYSYHQYHRHTETLVDSTFSLKKHYLSFNPTLVFNWYVSPIQEISLHYSYSRKVPNINQLSGYVDKRGIYNWDSGNPGLKPANYHNIAVGYTFGVQNLNASAEVIYKQTNNDIATIGYYLPNNIRLIKPVNVGKTKELSVVFTNWIRLSPQFSMTNSASYHYKNINQENLRNEANAFGLDGEKLIYTQSNFNWNSNFTYSFNSRNNASMNLNYYSKSLQFYGYKRPWLSSSLNYSLKLLKNEELKLIFGIENFTDGLFDRVAVNNNMGTYTTTLEDLSAYRRTFRISVLYIINKGDKGTKKLVY